MKYIRLMFIAGLALLTLVPSTVFGLTKDEKPLGEFEASFGGVYPQGDFVTFSDPGPGINLRINLRPKSFRAASLRIELGGNFFKSENESFWVDLPGGSSILAEKTVSQTAWTLHTGLQLGSDTRRGFLRPRISFSPGLYVFNIKTAFKWDGDVENFYEENETKAKFGWRGTVGTSLFFATGWGLSFDFVYDHVYSLHRSAVEDSLGRIIATPVSANFHGYMVGIVIPLNN